MTASGGWCLGLRGFCKLKWGERVLLLNYRMHTVYLLLFTVLQVVTYKVVASGRQIVCSLCLGEPVCSCVGG